MYCLTILETKNLRSRYRQGRFLRRALRKNLFHASLVASMMASNPCYSLVYVYSIPISASAFTWHSTCMFLSSCGHLHTACLCVQISFSYKYTRHVGLRAHPTSVWHHLNSTNGVCKDPIFPQNHIIIFSFCPGSKVLGIRTSTDLFGKHNLTDKREST